MEIIRIEFPAYKEYKKKKKLKAMNRKIKNLDEFLTRYPGLKAQYKALRSPI